MGHHFFSLSITVLFLLANPIKGQSVYWDWQKPSQPYLKIAVVEDGVYRVTGQELRAKGLNLSGIDPSFLQLFEHGKEIPIWYQGGSTMGDADYIEFIGKQNRGEDETWAYDAPESQGSTRFSLYSDTTFYWLSWTGSETGLRYVQTTPTQFAEGATMTQKYVAMIWQEQEAVYHYGDGDAQVSNPLFTRGEGMYWSSIVNTSSSPVNADYTIPLSNAEASVGDSLEINVRISTLNATSHRIGLSLNLKQGGGTGYKELVVQEWSGWFFRDLRAKIPLSDLANLNQLQVRIVSYNPLNETRPQVYLDYIAVHYQRKLTATTGVLRLNHPNRGAVGFTTNGWSNGNVVVYNPNTKRRFEFTTGSGGGGAFYEKQNTGDLPLYAIQQVAIKKPVLLSQVQSSHWRDTTNAADYVIITTKTLLSSANQMAAYRQQKDGFKTVVVDVRELYNEFDFGRPTPIAIRRFVHQSQKWQIKPKFLLFWGDALYPDRKSPHQPWEVPSFGRPSSDGWFALGLGGDTDWREVVSVGRLNVRDNEVYGTTVINKIKQYEQVPVDVWNKKLIGLAGGLNVYEQVELKRNVVRWMKEMAGKPFGADTTFISKGILTDVLDTSLLDSLQTRIRKGAGMMLYFGHSSAFSWEIVTRPVTEWNNASRLPIVFSLGCTTGAFAGDRFADPNNPVFAESLLFSPNGGIAHWGGSGSSYISFTADMVNHVIPRINRDGARRLGDIFRLGKQAYLDSLASRMSTVVNGVRVPGKILATERPYELMHVLQYNLIGDPATQTRLPSQSNYRLLASDIVVLPASPVPADSALSVRVNLHNLGNIPEYPSLLKLEHERPGGGVTVYEQRIAPVAITESYTFKVKINDQSVGQNKIRITTDAQNEIAESDETDNFVEKSITIFSNGVSVVSPINFGVEPTLTPTLRVSTLALSQNDHAFIFEMDSTRTFTSPFKRSFQTTTNALTAEWKQSTPLVSGRTYYWRARLDNPSQSENWTNAAFTVRTDLAAGWLQQRVLFEGNVHSPQLSYSDPKWTFATTRTEINIDATSGGTNQNNKCQYLVNGEPFLRLKVGYGILTLDGYSGKVKEYFSGAINSSLSDWQQFRTIYNNAGKGDYVMVRTCYIGSTPVADSLKTFFRGLGSTAIDRLLKPGIDGKNQNLWAMITRKGMPEATTELTQSSSNITELDLPVTLSFLVSEAQTTSPPIGPALSWKTVTWGQNFPIGDADRSITFDILPANGDTPLLSGLKEPLPAIGLAGINAKTHPFIRLRATFRDGSHKTTPQLHYAHVAFDPVPDIALIPAEFTLGNETLAEGAMQTVQVKLQNLSQTTAGKIRALFVLTNAQNQTSIIGRDSVATLVPNAIASFSKSIATVGLAGKNQIQVFIEQVDVPEVIVFNNTLLKNFTVVSDKQAPSYRVTVDGVELLNDPKPIVNPESHLYPFVTATPVIEVMLSDNDQNRLLDDVKLFTLKLNNVNVDLAGPNVTFIKGTSADNRARIIYKPDLTGKDGTYTLSLAVRDVSGNQAEPYQVHFRVQNAAEIESLYPYPNPMINQTTFAFRLRGAATTLVEDLRIRVFTVGGRLVREFDLVKNPTELQAGVLRTNWNMVKWDGTDADGDALATGTYLYKVILRTKEGLQAVNSESSVEKLVIIR
ncbi:MAG TPA: C25 family cysteine peptidase [Rhodothermales bacterium]|nr:C25 family cysteine peptidase [Rhodothermales bacterium]